MRHTWAGEQFPVSTTDKQKKKWQGMREREKKMMVFFADLKKKDFKDAFS